MSRRAVTLPLLLALLAGPASGLAQTGEAAPAAAEGEESEEEKLRERITERKDQRRPLEPFTVEIGGHPLTLGGEYEIAHEQLRERAGDRARLDQQLELEAFYTIGKPFAAFAQAQLKHERDLSAMPAGPQSESYLTRGEMWLYTEGILGSHFNLDIGRLDYEDERRWWWDEELDSLRLAYETGSFELALSLARELLPARSDRDEVAPAQENVHRIIGEASWDFSPGHVAQLLLLRQRDQSLIETVGTVVPAGREDEFDADATWLGARLMGAVKLRSQALLGYWLDAAQLRGREWRIEYDQASAGSNVVETVGQRLRGWAFDAGVNAMLPLRLEPRVFAGYAAGSGDAAPDDGRDEAFHQTGLQANEAGFGGVERYESYGIALAPELSNLRIATLGAGLSLFKSSSLDLVYHGYRLNRPADSLRDARFDVVLDGASRGLGQGFDAVLAVEEWQRFELTLAVSGFRAGRAFAAGQGEWRHAGFLALRYAF